MLKAIGSARYYYNFVQERGGGGIALPRHLSYDTLLLQHFQEILASMQPIRIATISRLAGAPYQYLRSVSGIDFREGSPTKNAEDLWSGVVDAALIPAIDFGLKGCYHSLGFGLGCRSRSQSMILYGHDRFDQIEAVRAYSCSSSSSALLSLLFHERIGRVPHFSRSRELEFRHEAGDGVATLVLHDLPKRIDESFPLHLDLATEWATMTRLPFVFLIWAVRPRALSGVQLTLLTDALYRAVAVDRQMARSMSLQLGIDPATGEEFAADDRRFYLDDFLLGGLEEFYSRMARCFRLPGLRYRQVQKSLFGAVVTEPRARF